MYLNTTKSVVASPIATALLSFLFLATQPSALSAQSVTFSYAQTALPLPSNLTIGAVATDSSGNIYFSSGNSLMKVPAGGGQPTQIASVSNSVFSIAVDAAGNVFYVTGQAVGSQVLKLPVGGGAPTSVGTSIVTPSGLAIDSQQNVYVADSGTDNAIFKIASDGNGAQTTVPVAGVTAPTSVALDAAGNIYVGGHGTIVELPVSGGAPININTGIDLSTVQYFIIVSLAVDGPGNIYYSSEILLKPVNVANTPQPMFQIVEIPVTGTAVFPYLPEGKPGSPGQLATDKQGDLYVVNENSSLNAGILEIERSVPVNFGNVNVCAAGQTQPAPCSEAATLGYQVTASGTFGGATVVTNGSTSDFQQTGANTCVGQLSAGQTCLVGVTFTPSIPNAQTGTVQILDSTSKVVATTGLKGYGLGVTQSMPFVTSEALTALRNNYSGFVGFSMTVGTSPVVVSYLGRYVVQGNSGTHVLKLVNSNGTDVAGGSVSLALAGATAGSFQYAALASSITLQPNTSYFLVSQETAGGDQWYDVTPVSATAVAAVTAPVYTYGSGSYYQVPGLSGDSYVPLNFLYSASSVAAISANITSPSPGSTLSSTSNVTVSTTGAVASLQLQVDGANQGSAVSTSTLQGPPYTLSLDTTLLVNGSHTLTVVAYDAQLNSVTSPGVSVTVSNAAVALSSFVTGEALSVLRNNYSGFVGFAMTTGNTAVAVSSLGRYVAPNNAGSHLLKLVNSNGTDVAGGSVTVSLAGATQGTFSYGALSSPVTLAANTSYFLLSQETAGGDQWYDVSGVSTTPVATVTAPVYSYGSGSYYQVPGLSGKSYVPVSFLYGSTGSTALSVSITSPQGGAVLSGSSVPVSVATTGSFTSLQLKVDGSNQGSAVSAGPLTLNTTVLTNGSHTLTVVITQSTTASVVSSGVTVTVSNTTTLTTFITGETPSVLRNNYSGFVGTVIQVGSTPLTVVSLGRFSAAGNNGIHIVKLVQANGTDVPGGSVSIDTLAGQSGQFLYAPLASPVVLLANTTYYVVSQETAGGDMWYDLEPVTGTTAAQILGATYTDGHGNYYVVGGLPGYSYVPVNFRYQ